MTELQPTFEPNVSMEVGYRDFCNPTLVLYSWVFLLKRRVQPTKIVLRHLKELFAVSFVYISFSSASRPHHSIDAGFENEQQVATAFY